MENSNGFPDGTWEKVDRLNREAAPLLVGLFIPLLLVGGIFLQMYVLDVWTLIQSVDILYWIVLFPIVLGLIFALMNRKE